jgi:hypothetical protein
MVNFNIFINVKLAIVVSPQKPTNARWQNQESVGGHNGHFFVFSPFNTRNAIEVVGKGQQNRIVQDLP